MANECDWFQDMCSECNPAFPVTPLEYSFVGIEGAGVTVMQTPPSASGIPVPAGEGAALVGELPPPWHFTTYLDPDKAGARMNIKFWQVIYTIAPGQMEFSQDYKQSAFDKLQAYLRTISDDAREKIWVDKIEIKLKKDVKASDAADDLTAKKSHDLYHFECGTAALLVQFAGVLRGLRNLYSKKDGKAESIFNKNYGNFRYATLYSGVVEIELGSPAFDFNLDKPDKSSIFKLKDFSNTPGDHGLLRGDWILLDNTDFIKTGAFQRENAIYLGKKRFYGNGIGIFTIDSYVKLLHDKHAKDLSIVDILARTTVIPKYRPKITLMPDSTFK